MNNQIKSKKEELKKHEEELMKDKEELNKLIKTWDLYENSKNIYYNLPLKEDIDEYALHLSWYNCDYGYKHHYNKFKKDLKYFKNVSKQLENIDFICSSYFITEEMTPEEIYDFQITADMKKKVKHICRELRLKIWELDIILENPNNESL